MKSFYNTKKDKEPYSTLIAFMSLMCLFLPISVCIAINDSYVYSHVSSRPINKIIYVHIQLIYA